MAMNMSLIPARAAAPLRAGALALASALALAACEAQPVGYFDRAEYRADVAASPYTLYFQPDSDVLVAGETQRVASYLKSLRLKHDDDILLEVGRSPSVVLDARRVQALRRTFAAYGSRVRVTVPRTLPAAEAMSNAVRVSVERYDLIVVKCPPVAQPNELSTPLPQLGCSNEINRATMAANKRDLIVPGELGGPDGGASEAAVQRYREGKVLLAPLQTTTSGN